MKIQITCVSLICSTALLGLVGCSSNDCVQSCAQSQNAAVCESCVDSDLPAKENASAKIAAPYLSALKDTAWVPVFLKGSDIPTPISEGGPVVYMRFDADGRVNGNSGDNLFGGAPEITSDGNFKAGNLFSTRRFGPNSKYEQTFLSALNKADKISVSGNTLTLSDSNGEILKFEKTPLDKIQSN